MNEDQLAAIWDLLGPAATGRAMMNGTYNTLEWVERTKEQLADLIHPVITVKGEGFTPPTLEIVTKPVEINPPYQPQRVSAHGGSAILGEGGSIHVTPIKNLGYTDQAFDQNDPDYYKVANKDIDYQPGDEHIKHSVYTGKPRERSSGSLVPYHTHINREVGPEYLDGDVDINFQGYKAGTIKIGSHADTYRYEQEYGDQAIMEAVEEGLQGQETLVGYDPNGEEAPTYFDRSRDGVATLRSPKKAQS